jgi:hypothetical protein
MCYHAFLPEQYVVANEQLHAPSTYSHRTYLGMHWIGGWLDPLAGMDATSKKKIGFSAGKQNPMYKNGPLQVNYRKGMYWDTSNPQLHVL